MPNRSKLIADNPHALDGVLDGLQVGVVVQGTGAEILYANEAAPRLLGLSLDQLVGRSSFDPAWNVIHADGRDYPGPEHPAPVALATGKPVRGAVMGVYRPARLDRVWLQVDAVPQVDDAGEVTHVLVTFTDISERLRLERALEQANEQLEAQVAERTEALRRSVDELSRQTELYRSVFEANAEGIAVHDADGRIVDANTSAERVLGLTLDQMQGRTEADPRWRLEEVDGSPLDAETVPSRVAQRDGVPMRDRLLAVHRPNGERAILSVNAQPVFADGHPEPRTVVATFQDITERHAAQQALQAFSDRLRRITETVPGLVCEWAWSGDGPLMLSFANEPARTTLALPDAGADIDVLCAHLMDRDKAPLAEALHRLRAGDTHAELQLQLADGRWHQLRIRAEHDAGGGRLLALFLDVDRQVRTEQAAREAQRREAVGELVAGVAHNFNNMLAAIVPNLEEAIERAPAALRPQLDDAATAARNAADLVRQLLVVARNDPEPHHHVVDLAGIVRDAVAMARRTFDRAIALEVELPHEPAWVSGRASHLQQVVLNLLLNARDALATTPRPRLAVRLRPDAAAETWHVDIVDNGSGMSRATLQRLGEPFFTTKGPGAGTGLGIATGVSIAREHGGALIWDSTLGEGSTFTLSLPAEPLATAPTARSVADAPAPLSGRVLVVDDESLVRRALLRPLRRLGLEVIEARDGQDGLRQFTAEHHALSAVFLDLSMPGVPGAEVLERLQAIDDSVPVVVLSGHVGNATDVEGAFEVLVKPVGPRELREVLTRALAPGG